MFVVDDDFSLFLFLNSNWSLSCYVRVCYCSETPTTLESTKSVAVRESSAAKTCY